MKRYALYEPTGEITRLYFGTDAEALLQPEGAEQLVEMGADDHPHHVYVDTAAGTVQARQAFALTISKTTLTADAVDEVVITNVPTDTVVSWPDGVADTVTDGEVRFSVDLEGTYTLKFSHVQYLDQEVVLEAVTPA